MCFRIIRPARRLQVLLLLGAAAGCLAFAAGTATASSAHSARKAAGQMDCGSVVGPQWRTFDYTGRHYLVSATKVSCATAISYFRRLVSRRYPSRSAGGQLGSWHPLANVNCLIPNNMNGQLATLGGGCQLGSHLVIPGYAPAGSKPPGPAELARVKSFRWSLCQYAARTHPECTVTFVK